MEYGYIDPGVGASRLFFLIKLVFSASFIKLDMNECICKLFIGAFTHKTCVTHENPVNWGWVGGGGCVHLHIRSLPN